MSRTIKFRAWDAGKMWSLCHAGGANPAVYSDPVGWLECTPEAVIMQYTGLKDKTGREIYQGDIIAIKRDKEGYGHTSYGGFAEVTAETCGYSLKCFNPSFEEMDNNPQLDDEGEPMAWDSSSLWHTDEPENIEVIGNIYENPELLTKNV